MNQKNGVLCISKIKQVFESFKNGLYSIIKKSKLSFCFVFLYLLYLKAKDGRDGGSKALL